ncbi:MAG: DUF4114 domain-containing protein [Xenococcaceae cyanobacterium]
MVTSSFNRSSPNGSNGFVVNDSTNELDVSGYSSSEAENLNEDSQIDYSVTTTNTYDDDGSLLSTVDEYDYNADNIIDYSVTTTNTYDDDGSLLSTVDEYDWDVDDGRSDYLDSTTYSYDNKGLLLSTFRKYGYNADDGRSDYLDLTTYSYDENGLLLSTLNELDRYGDSTIDERSLTTYSYDDKGLLLSTLEEEDDDADGEFDYLNSTTYSYDENGLLLSTVEEYGYLGWGYYEPNERYLTTYSYDPQGLLLSTLYGYDEHADGEFNWSESTTYSYDDKGLLLSTLEEYGYYGGIDERSLTTYSYDDKGLLLSTLEEFDRYVYLDDSIIDYRSLTTYSYDDKGLLLSTLDERNRDEDSIIDSRELTTTNTYDDKGLLLSTLDEYDGDGDGIIDHHSLTTYSYDPQGLLLSTLYERARDEDGIIDSRELTTNTYDEEGLLLSTLEERDSYSDGTIEDRYRESTTNTYDDEGLLLFTRSEYNHNGDGGWESTTYSYDDKGLLLSTLEEREKLSYHFGLTTYSYDETGLLLSTLEEGGWNADGIIDERSLTTYSYDETGLLLSTLEEEDWDADGIIDERKSITNRYDPQGSLLSTLDERDRDGDGIIDYRESTTHGYNPQGLLLSTVEEDWDADGGLNYRESTTYTYDETGLLFSTLYEQDSYGDGIIDSRLETLYKSNYAPTVANPILDDTATENSLKNFPVPINPFTAEDEGDTLTYSASLADGSPLPSWLRFNANTVTFSGTPTNDNVGNFSIAVMADDGNGGKVSDLFDLTVFTDNDNDGIADWLETQAGDRNSDGIPDAQQGSVVSLPKLNGNPENPDDFFTLIAAEGIRFTNVKQITDNPAPDTRDAPDSEEFQFPLGFLDFEIEGFEPGEEVTIGLLLPVGVTANTYWLYNQVDRVWSHFLDDGETGSQFFDLVDQNGNFGQDGNADLVLLNFVDGERGDKDQTANGRIEEMGAPGIASPTLINSQGIVTTDGAVWEIQGSGAAAAPVEFTFNSSEADFVNEVGVFLVDESNRVNGIAPNDPRYAQEALTQGITIFSGLPDEEMLTGLNLSRRLQASPGDRVAFYLVSDSTTDTMLQETNSTPNVFFSILEANPDRVDHLRVSESNDQWILEWEDLWAGGDRDFNDLVMEVELVSEPLSLQQLTTSSQGFPEGELLDLRGLAGQRVEANLVVKGEAVFNNFFGLYQVENEQGTVRDPLSGEFLNPEDAGYTQAALRNSQESGFSLEAREGNWQTTLTLNGGFLFAPFLIADGSIELILDDDPDNDRPVYFSYMGANPDGVDHLRLFGDNTFGFEDLFGGGDLDYNDVVFQVHSEIV